MPFGSQIGSGGSCVGSQTRTHNFGSFPNVVLERYTSNGRPPQALASVVYNAATRFSADYPMVAPNYAKARSMLAKKMGLGQKRGKRK